MKGYSPHSSSQRMMKSTNISSVRPNSTTNFDKKSINTKSLFLIIKLKSKIKIFI